MLVEDFVGEVLLSRSTRSIRLGGTGGGGRIEDTERESNKNKYFIHNLYLQNLA